VERKAIRGEFLRMDRGWVGAVGGCHPLSENGGGGGGRVGTSMEILACEASGFVVSLQSSKK
jgi:hypothetical protein